MTTADVVGENILKRGRHIRWGLESSLAISLLLFLLMLSPADYDKVLFKTLSSCLHNKALCLLKGFDDDNVDN